MRPPIPISTSFLHRSLHYFPAFFTYFLLLLSFSSPVESQIGSSQNFFPAEYPLAVRSPYLNTWQSTPMNTTSLTKNWPTHWSGAINGWSGFVRIDGITWEWLGSANMGNATTIQSTYVTPTRTVFELLAGPMTLNITFFSPIETGDLTRQSLPFSYVSFECQSRDGAAHEIEVYSDISAEWISGNRGNQAKWSFATTASSFIHSANRGSPQSMAEIANQAEDGTVYYAMQKTNGVTYQSGKDLDVRNTFLSKGTLLDTVDANFRPINQDFVVFGIASSLGTITSTSTPVVWALGLVRDPITTYPSASGGSLQNQRPYFYSDNQFSSGQINDVIDFFLRDYGDAVKRADTLDAKIQADATAASPNDNGQYYNLVALAAKQAMAGMDITFAQVQDGGINRTDIKSFMRNTGIDTSVTNVPTLYSSFPAYLYLNATWGGYLLDSLLQFQNSSAYTNQYAAPDLGSTYPQASGDGSDTSQFSVEDTASMLIMVLAQARATGDGTLIVKYYNLLKRWADYLVKNALHPQNQVSSDNVGPTVTDSTQLAMKGIIGIGAMSQISKAFGNSNDAQAYNVNASTFAIQWKSLALGSGKITATYNDPSSFALMYDLYSDALLQTGLFDSDVYNAQTTFIKSNNEAGVGSTFGIPIDSSSGTSTKSTRLMFLAGALNRIDNSTRNLVISSVFARANFNGTGGLVPITYDSQKGQAINGNSGQASPAQGAMFSLLALTLPNQNIGIPNLDSTPAKKTNNAGAIAGAVVGGLAGVTILVAAGIFFWRRRRRAQRSLVEPRNSHRFSMAQHQLPSVTPFLVGGPGQSQGNSSYDPYGNMSSASLGPTGVSRVLAPGATAEQLSPPIEGVASGLVGAAYASRETQNPSGGGSPSSSEKRPFAPIRPSNWDQVMDRNQSGFSERSGPGSPTFSQSAGSGTASSRYPRSGRSDATSQLRNEVEDLRREMEQLRAQAREYEPPPSYN